MRSTFISFLILFSIVITLNGQNKWEVVNEGVDYDLKSVDFINDNTGWIAGENGIFLTTNGCKNWAILNRDLNFNLIDFYDESIGWATVGRDSLLLFCHRCDRTKRRTESPFSKTFWQNAGKKGKATNPNDFKS